MRTLAITYATLLALTLTATGCAHLKTANDLALDACELFAAAHPVQARELVDRVAPEYSQRAASSGDADAFAPEVLCLIPAVVDLFLADQQEQLARLSRPEPDAIASGGECVPPGGD